MYTDIIFIEKSEEINKLAKRLGFGNVIFLKKSDVVSGIKNNKKKPIVLGGNSELNRRAVTSKNTTILLDPEPMDEGNTGMNHVLCKLAKENNVAIGISFSRILNEKNRIVLLNKIIKNIRLYRKYKIRVILGSFATDVYEMRDALDLIAFARFIGMDTKSAKNSLVIARDILGTKFL
ncbi:MAG: RNase P subunit p30 family protein [Nanoarchaeota archaeon]